MYLQLLMQPDRDDYGKVNFQRAGAGKYTKQSVDVLLEDGFVSDYYPYTGAILFSDIFHLLQVAIWYRSEACAVLFKNLPLSFSGQD